MSSVHDCRCGVFPRRFGCWLLGLIVVAATVALPVGRASASGSSAGRARPVPITLRADTASQEFGAAIATTGTSALVGASGDGAQTGAAYLYTETSSGWSTNPTAVFRGDDSSDWFGSSVALTSSIAAVGAPNWSSGTGAVYLFTRTADGWSATPTAVLHGGHVGDSFGRSVALANHHLLVGATSAYGTGAAFLFTRTSTGWNATPRVIFHGFATPYESFGWSVALTATDAIVGAPCTSQCEGAAYVYSKGPKSWPRTPTTTLADHATYSQFGISLAVSDETLAVGAVFHDDNAGAAYVFTKDADAWHTEPVASYYGAANSEFGASVALRGARLAVGAVNDLHGLTRGEAFEFVNHASGWPQQSRFKLRGHERGDVFGGAVALAHRTLFVGAPNESSQDGAVYVFAT